ncbi:MAG TPA: hypothetical protein DDY31_11630 [Lachnospiraceae bacterium]|nr:hypothetical protein [Lachnospiraceae bacterium]
MEEIEIYENYFRKEYQTIDGIIEYFYQNGKTMAVWGAGLRGRAFLNVFDAGNQRISYVFDKDVKKHGKKLENGHEITDFINHDVDIVIAANNVLEYRILHTLRTNGKSSVVLNIDNIILGGLKKEEIIRPPKRFLQKVRDVRIGAVVVAYHPDSAVVENIKSYAKDLEIVYVHDNSEEKNEEFEKKINQIENVIYNFSGENQGLCVPFNKYYKLAIKKGLDWLITFDQDSAAAEGMIPAMQSFAESSECLDTIGIVSPTINELDYSSISQDSLFTYYDLIIQSGAMHRLSMMEKVGDYNEDLFIDAVDWEYCVRCRMEGYRIVRLNQAILLHNQSDNAVKEKFVGGKMIYIDKFSPARYYYRYRNALYCYRKYKEIDPVYGLVCLNTLKKLKINLECDTDCEIKKKAIEAAIEDFENNNMGKLNRQIGNEENKDG